MEVLWWESLWCSGDAHCDDIRPIIVSMRRAIRGRNVSRTLAIQGLGIARHIVGLGFGVVYVFDSVPCFGSLERTVIHMWIPSFTLRTLFLLSAVQTTHTHFRIPTNHLT